MPQSLCPCPAVDVSTPVVSDAGSYADEPDVVPGADDENFWGYWGGLFSDGEELPAANKEVIGERSGGGCVRVAMGWGREAWDRLLRRCLHAHCHYYPYTTNPIPSPLSPPASIQELIRDTDLCGPSLPSPPHARPAPYPHEESAYLPPKVLAAPAQFTFYQQPSSDSDPGAQVLVVPVSWQFDEGRAYWDKGAHEADLPVGEAHRVSSFVAAGLVAVEARTRRVRWSRVLDLSSKGTRYQVRGGWVHGVLCGDAVAVADEVEGGWNGCRRFRCAMPLYRQPSFIPSPLCPPRPACSPLPLSWTWTRTGARRSSQPRGRGGCTCWMRQGREGAW